MNKLLVVISIIIILTLPAAAQSRLSHVNEIAARENPSIFNRSTWGEFVSNLEEDYSTYYSPKDRLFYEVYSDQVRLAGYEDLLPNHVRIVDYDLLPRLAWYFGYGGNLSEHVDIERSKDIGDIPGVWDPVNKIVVPGPTASTQLAATQIPTSTHMHASTQIPRTTQATQETPGTPGTQTTIVPVNADAETIVINRGWYTIITDLPGCKRLGDYEGIAALALYNKMDEFREELNDGLRSGRMTLFTRGEMVYLEDATTRDKIPYVLVRKSNESVAYWTSMQALGTTALSQGHDVEYVEPIETQNYILPEQTEAAEPQSDAQEKRIRHENLEKVLSERTNEEFVKRTERVGNYTVSFMIPKKYAGINISKNISRVEEGGFNGPINCTRFEVSASYLDPLEPVVGISITEGLTPSDPGYTQEVEPCCGHSYVYRTIDGHPGTVIGVGKNSCDTCIFSYWIENDTRWVYGVMDLKQIDTVFLSQFLDSLHVEEDNTQP